MVETGKEYVLQWSGHAARITERFSGLLARQALVDVTLLCQEQKLRVHKLVLASCSLYFEEILEQDLGQEPIILLNDLDFDILKAMVEFMYCGETTIAHCHLRSLLNASQVFQVKDLESILEGMLDTLTVEKSEIRESLETEDIGQMCSTAVNRNCIQVKLNGMESCDKSGMVVTDLFDDSSSKTKQIIDNSSIDDEDREGNSSCEIIDSTNAFAATEEISEGGKNDCRIKNEGHRDDYEVNDNSDSLDLPRKVGECYKVYSHKKRKTIDRKKNPLTRLCKLMPEKLTTNCIDLSYDDSNCDITPVTLPSTLEMETTDYIWSLSALISDRHRSLYDENFEESGFYYPNCMRQMKELFSIDNRNIPIRTPVLRRSVRLNQLENDDSVNNNSTNNNNNSETNVPRRDSSKDFSLKSLKMKRKMKESDENHVSQKKNVHSRALRSTTKLASKTNGRCSFTKIDKDEKSKSGKLKGEKLEKTESLDTEVFVPLRLNTIASVDRALWGDMSDVMESRENESTGSPEYSSKEIPFAVGLLPLRAALERMQAIPDYQPRKTRSSVTPMKQELNSLKRKTAPNDSESILSSKQQSNPICSINDTSKSEYSESNHVSSEFIQIQNNVKLVDPLLPITSTSVKR